MKKVPSLTILFWFLLVAAYRFFPHLLEKEPLLYPLVILLSILLPVSFWLEIQDGRRYRSLIFVCIFFINITVLLFALGQNYTAQRMLENTGRKGIYPEIAELLTHAETLEKRRLAARFIYQRYAVVMPYRSADSTYVLYVPNPIDRDRYRTNFVQTTHAEVARMQATEQVLTDFLFLLLHAGIFLVLMVFLSVYDQEGPPAETSPANPGKQRH